jgi:O-acetyl-ADP-ribose deacetylase (regulator of RNase III)
MIEWKRGDVFTSKAEALVNPVNCRGVSGAGLAKSFAQRFPIHTSSYKEMCREGIVRPGNVYFFRPVVYFPTKDDWRNPSTLEYINTGLESFVKSVGLWKVESCAFPPLGCGLGGLDWKTVKPIMQKYLENLGMKIEIYEPERYHASIRLRMP